MAEENEDDPISEQQLTVTLPADAEVTDEQRERIRDAVAEALAVDRDGIIIQGP